jgi:Stage II sporulation protein E (SpoIIE)
MDYLHVEVDVSASAKHPGAVSGDIVRVLRSPGWTTVVVCDGMGSGIRANVAATLHTSRLLELEKAGLSLRDAFARVVGTIHQGRGKNHMYAALSVARIMHSGETTVLTYDMAAPIHAARMHASLLPQRVFYADDAELGETNCQLGDGEGLLLVSDGITAAGVGTEFAYGWGIEQAAHHVDGLLARKVALRKLPGELQAKAAEHWGSSLGDDVTVALIRCRPGRQLSILTGPPSDPALDTEWIERFLASPGAKVVCGSTTADIVSRQLGESPDVDLDDSSMIAPPKYRLAGVDLATEGAVTLMQAYNILEEDPSRYEEDSGVTELCDLLRSADRIHFFVGSAVNPAHKSIAFLQKGILPRVRTVALLREALTKAGKLVVVDTA